MERNNSPLVTNDLMELQLPPVRGPIMAATVGDEDDALEGGAETLVKAQDNELYIGDAESEDEASVVDDGGVCEARRRWRR
jgi:hypothetical protein